MKSTAKLFGLIALIALIGFSAAACRTGNEPDYGPGTPPGGNPFIGTWTGDYGDGDYMHLVCTDTTWTTAGSDFGDFSGTYTRNGNNASFYVQGVGVGSATVSGNTMTGIINGESFTVYKSGGNIVEGDWIWFAYSDQYDNGGNSIITMTKSSEALTFTGEIKTGNPYPYAGFNATPNDDGTLALLGTAAAVKFDFYGDGKTYRFKLPTSDITDYCFYEKTFTSTANTWQAITINVSELAQPDWGEEKSFNQSLVTMVEWQTNEEAMGTFSVSIKNLELIQGGGGEETPLAYELINGGTAYRVRKGAATGSTVVIPATYNSLPVTEIGSADDPSGAFSSTNITSVSIPASVTSIGSFAFSGCANLATVTFAADSQLTTIGSFAFSGCAKLTAFAIPANVTSIGGFAFSQCAKITNIDIPASVTTVGWYAFDGWTSSQTINVPFANGDTPSGWDNGWNYDCHATINYTNGGGGVTVPNDLREYGR